jgi:hypothetical protein
MLRGMAADHKAPADTSGVSLYSHSRERCLRR